MLNIKMTAEVEFDLRKMAHEGNGYNLQLVHPHNFRVKFISRNDKEVTLSVAQLALITAIVEKYPNTGSAIDHLFSKLTQDEVSEICKEF